jgi:hypothetical protein
MCCAWLLSVASSAFDIYFARIGILDTDTSTDPEWTIDDVEFMQEVSPYQVSVEEDSSRLTLPLHEVILGCLLSILHSILLL